MKSAGKGMKKVNYRLPNSSYNHLVCRWADPKTILVINQQGRQHLDHEDKERASWLQTIQEEVDKAAAEQLYWYVATHTNAPILPEWRTQVWDYAQRYGGLNTLTAFGDCVAAHVIKDELINKMSWVELVAEMVRDGAVTFGQPQDEELTREPPLPDKSSLIQRVNDDFRQNQCSTVPGTTVITAAISYLAPLDIINIKANVKAFCEFNEGNDPYAEHDLGSFEYTTPDRTYTIRWKIDYYSDEECLYGSEDPSDMTQTYRVMSIMLAEDY